MPSPPRHIDPLELPEAFWRERLGSAQYRVLRLAGTEAPGSSPLNHEQRAGTYVCAGCALPLFSSQDKYDSGSGWPSFMRPLNTAHLGQRVDQQLRTPRVEYHCARCGGHQGHVFDDGPAPVGQRWCNNGTALKFIPAGEVLPEPPSS